MMFGWVLSLALLVVVLVLVGASWWVYVIGGLLLVIGLLTRVERR